jgi:hypothetical protein
MTSATAVNVLANDNYLYDVFISYPRERANSAWVYDVFIPMFELHLREQLGRTPTIFLDKDDIAGGDSWKLKPKNALAHAKVLVPVLSVQYFLSDNCRGEYAVMMHREEQMGFRTRANPSGLIVPIRLFDGQHFSDYVKGIQYCDCTEFYVEGDYFRKSKGFMDLQLKIREWVPDVAGAITRVPAWSNNWTIKEWLDDPYDGASTNPRLGIKVLTAQPPSLAERPV